MDNILERMMATQSNELPDRLGRAMALGDPAADRAPTALESIRSRLCNLNERAGNHETRLEDLRDRLLTPEPRNEKGPNKQPTEVCGQVGQIEIEIQRLEEILDHNTHVIARLEDL